MEATIPCILAQDLRDDCKEMGHRTLLYQCPQPTVALHETTDVGTTASAVFTSEGGVVSSADKMDSHADVTDYSPSMTVSVARSNVGSWGLLEPSVWPLVVAGAILTFIGLAIIVFASRESVRADRELSGFMRRGAEMLPLNQSRRGVNDLESPDSLPCKFSYESIFLLRSMPGLGMSSAPLRILLPMHSRETQ